MRVCIGCSNHSSKVDNTTERTLICENKDIKFTEILQIFSSEIIKLFSDFKVSSNVCDDCLQQLKATYKFVQAIKRAQLEINTLKRCPQISNEKQQLEGLQQENLTSNIKEKQQYLGNKVSASFTYVQRKFKTILPKNDISSSNIQKREDKRNTSNTRQHCNIGARTYKCIECGENVGKYTNLKDHMKGHKSAEIYLQEAYIFICQQCHLTFNKKTDLLDHKKLQHTDDKFLCYLCNDQRYSAKGFLLRHCIKKHNHNINYYCGYCRELTEFQNCNDLKEHILEKHTNKTQQQHQLQEQQHQCLNETSNVDDGIKISLNGDQDMELEMHEEFLDEFLLAHTNGDSTFAFSECWADLDLHLPDMLHIQQDQISSSPKCQISNILENFLCTECPKQFKHPQKLIEHLTTQHKCRYTCNNEGDTTKMICPYCKKTFVKIVQLKQHLRIVHARNKRHMCQLCDKLFSTIDHLKKHVLSQHQNERKHICQICDKGFTQSCHLRQHLAIHTKMKNFQCNNCSNSFWRKIDLERHKKLKHKNINM